MEEEVLSREEMDAELMHIFAKEEEKISRIEEQLAYILDKTEVENKQLKTFAAYNQLDLEEIAIPIQQKVLSARLRLNIYETELKHYAKKYQIKDADENLIEDYENIRRHIQLVRILYLEDLEPAINDAFLARLGILAEGYQKKEEQTDLMTVEDLLEKYFGIYHTSLNAESFGITILEELLHDIGMITGKNTKCGEICDILLDKYRH